ncbi:hypothetical protein OJ997_11580 [Solirubrobacter phytolaccae]|uniref:Uncharacterized protein n=1 Tax=Solirubrobacter phytolaccae TaxID=1404360 RepID=A0A9X3N9Y6_9ACTN|nr:hypothetical protein [Solirubrobacter phytolaccae]MDA0180937.1 hypothetical protein [Solirubrobacter phytolaccae]
MPARAFTALGGLVLLASLLMPWYDAGFVVSAIGPDGTSTYGGIVSAWEAFAVFDVLLATLAIATVLLAFRRLAAPATAFAALATVLIALKLVWRPDGWGTTYGVWIALAASLATLVAARGIGART